MIQTVKNKLIEKIDAARVTEQADMSRVCSFRAGGKAELFVEPETQEQLIYAMETVKEAGVPFLILGNGSNVLIKDGGYKGVVIKIGNALSEIKVEDTVLTCGAGALLSLVAKTALAHELTGFEFASGIPGSIGGAIFMNAGAYGGEMKDIVISADLYDVAEGKVKTVSVEELDLGYRHSAVQATGDVVLSVKIGLEKGNPEEISATMKDLMTRRNTKQPVQYPSAGSFFKRPEGYFAGKLVQDAGLKGLQVGGAQVSELHAGFVINKDNATATDIVKLMHLVQNTVYDQFGVMLEPEVRIIGEDE